MARKEKFQWTMPRAIFWLQEELKRGGSEEVEPTYASDPLEFANGLRAEIDEKTRELNRFVFTVAPAEERVESFESSEIPWGTCSAEGSPVSRLVWKTEPALPGGTPEDEEVYQDLLRRYLRPQWSDPCSGWCPDVADDLQDDWVAEALGRASDEGTFLVGVDEEGNESSIYVVRSEKEAKAVRLHYRSVRELPVSEAYSYVDDHYPDSFDWPDSVDEASEDEVESPPCRMIEKRDIRAAFDLVKADARWRAVHDGCRKSCKAYVKLRALAVFCPDLVSECRTSYDFLLAQAEVPFSVQDWDSLAQASVQAGLEKVLPPEEFKAKILKIEEEGLRVETEDRRRAALREKYTPQEVLEMFRGALERWRTGKLSAEQYDIEVARVEELLKIVCSRHRLGAAAAMHAFEKERFPHACTVHGI